MFVIITKMYKNNTLLLVSCSKAHYRQATFFGGLYFRGELTYIRPCFGLLGKKTNKLEMLDKLSRSRFLAPLYSL